MVDSINRMKEVKSSYVLRHWRGQNHITKVLALAYWLNHVLTIQISIAPDGSLQVLLHKLRVLQFCSREI